MTAADVIHGAEIVVLILVLLLMVYSLPRRSEQAGVQKDHPYEGDKP